MFSVEKVNIIPHVKTFKTYKPLAYVLAWRENEDYHLHYSDLEGRVQVRPEHVELAQTIQDYYTDKLIHRKLTQSHMSNPRSEAKRKFQDHLAQTLRDNDKYRLAENLLPIMYRLRDFYEQDCAEDYLAQNYRSTLELQIPGLCMEGLNDLHYVSTVTVTNRRQRSHYYYFADQDQHLLRIRINKDNPLLPMMNLLQEARSISFLGHTKLGRLGRDHADFQVQEFLDNRWKITEITQK